jgi:hypothetical protein
MKLRCYLQQDAYWEYSKTCIAVAIAHPPSQKRNISPILLKYISESGHNIPDSAAMSQWGGRPAGSSGDSRDWAGAPAAPSEQPYMWTPSHWPDDSSKPKWKKAAQWKEGADWDPAKGFWKDLSHRDHQFSVEWGKLEDVSKDISSVIPTDKMDPPGDDVMILKSAVQDLSRTDKLAQDLFIRNLVFSVHRSISTATSDPVVQARVARLAADISRPRWTWDDVTTSATRNRQKPLKLHRAGF